MGKLLTEAQRRAYARDGIMFPLDVLSAEDIRRYAEACDDLEEHLGGRPRTVEVRQMHLHFRWAWELATHPRVLDAAEDVLGPDLLIWATELFAKHPQDRSVSIGWHRDGPYMGFDSPRTTTAWIALSDSRPANGCMRAVPDPLRGRPGERSETASAVDVTLQAGEMSLHDAAILHGSLPNLSADKRVGFAVRLVAPEARPLHGRPPAALARGRDRRGYFTLVDPPEDAPREAALARMRQSARLHLDAMLQNLRHASP